MCWNKQCRIADSNFHMLYSGITNILVWCCWKIWGYAYSNSTKHASQCCAMSTTPRSGGECSEERVCEPDCDLYNIRWCIMNSSSSHGGISSSSRDNLDMVRGCCNGDTGPEPGILLGGSQEWDETWNALHTTILSMLYIILWVNSVFEINQLLALLLYPCD